MHEWRNWQTHQTQNLAGATSCGFKSHLVHFLVQKNKIMEHTINIIRSRRRSLSIEVDRSGSVIVRAPYRMPNSEIKAFILEKQDWIAEHVKEAIRRAAEAGEIEPLTRERLEELFEEAGSDIPVRVRKYAGIMGVSYGRITIRNQKTRWGSCSAKGNLNFNCLLMLAPEDVRDYVVIHELAHRKHMNHSGLFWQEVEAVMPDYREKRRWLKEHGDLLMQRMLRMQE